MIRFLNLLVQEKLNLIEIIILAFYYLFASFLILAVLGFFNRLSVSLVFIFLFFSLFLLRKSVSFSKKFFWFFLIVPVVTAGFGYLRGFFSGDAYALWLSIAREIARSGYIPDFYIGTPVSREPLLSLLFAATFSFFGSFSEFLCLWVPFLFTSATLIIIYQWAKNKKLGKIFLFFVPFLFLSNVLINSVGGWNLLQESLILFFATAFFYYYDNYLADKKFKDLFFLILSFVLACASKISGPFLVLLLVYLFLKSKNKKQILFYLVLLSLPIIIWFARNYLVFDNPIFPLFNSLFKGRYYQVVNNYQYFRNISTDFSLARFSYAFSLLIFAFPFLFLALYQFIKSRRWDYLVFFFAFVFFKEIFLFTVTASNVRYYYSFLGLFLVYALVGLERLKSKWLLGLFTLVALGQILFIPVTDSSSQFISFFEDKFSFLGNLFVFLHNHWYLALLILVPFIYKFCKRDGAKIFLIFLYCLFILNLSFVVNKSWLNVWPFIILALILLIFFSYKEIRYFKLLLAGLIVLIIFLNSWFLGSLYYLNQGKVEIPVPFLYESSSWAKEILDQRISSKERQDFYILVTDQDDYFSWFTDYKTLTFMYFNFFLINKDYRENLTSKEIADMFTKNKIKYIIKNSSGYDFSNRANREFQRFFDIIENSPRFKLIASRDNKDRVWQTY